MQAAYVSWDKAEAAFYAAETAHRNALKQKKEDPQLILAMSMAAHALALYDTVADRARD